MAETDESTLAITLSPTPIVAGTNEDLSGRLYSKFLTRKSYYSDRNAVLEARTSLFEGNHWGNTDRIPTSADDEEFRLTFNYLRNIVLRFTATLARQPKPKVPTTGTSSSMEGQRASKQQKLLMGLWPDLMQAWYDIEMDASKLSYGVLQVIWAPEEGQPESINMGRGEDVQMARVFTKCPFIFRPIPPQNFYPIYRTYNRPNDFLAVFRFDPGRLIDDLEDQYGLPLAPAGGTVLGAEPTADLIEYWDKEKYVLLAITRVLVDKRNPRAAGNRPPRAGDLEFEERYTILEENDHEYGRVPFWVLQNIRSDPHKDPTDFGSMSDLDDTSELNKHFNEMASEVAAEVITNIHRPLIYSSEEHQQDPGSFRYEAGAVIPIGAEETVEALPSPTETSMLPEHLDRIRQGLQDLSFLGEAGFGQIPSGMTTIGFKIALQPLQQIIELKLPLREAVLRDVCLFLLKSFRDNAGEAQFKAWVQNQYGQYGVTQITTDDLQGGWFVEVNYGNLLPRDDVQNQQNEVYLYKAGSQSLETTLAHLGFDDPGAEMSRIKEEQQDPVLNPEKAALIKQLGTPPPQQQPGGVPGGQPQPGAPGQPPMGGAMGGLGGLGGPGGPPQQTQPMVPGDAFGRNPQGGEFGAGPLTPFLGRGMAPASTGPNMGALPGVAAGAPGLMGGPPGMGMGGGPPQMGGLPMEMPGAGGMPGGPPMGGGMPGQPPPKEQGMPYLKNKLRGR